MTEPAPAEGDDRPVPRAVDPIPYPPDPMAPWLAGPAGAERDDEAEGRPGDGAGGRSGEGA